MVRSLCRAAAWGIGALAASAVLVRMLPEPAGPFDWRRNWSWDPVVLLNLGLLWWLYGRGLERLLARPGATYRVECWQPLAFLGALATIFFALVSPLDFLGGQLAWAHMGQHLLLMMVAGPLFVLGDARRVLGCGMPRSWRRAAGFLRRSFGPAGKALHSPGVPLVVWLIYALVLWSWHIPGLYEAALRHPLLHDAQHLTFFGAAYFFWRLMLDRNPARRVHPVAAVLFLFTTSLHASALGILLTLSPRAWYAPYAETAPAWGLTPLEDQQLAGLLMWIPACLLYAAAAVVVFGRWLGSESQRAGPGYRAPLLEHSPSR